MIERYRQVMKLISEQMKRYGMSYNAKGVVENATEKVQIKLAIAQNFATEKYNIVTKVSNIM